MKERSPILTEMLDLIESMPEDVSGSRVIEAVEEAIRQAEAAAREEERLETEFECWEEAIGNAEIFSDQELREWLKEQFQAAVRARETPAVETAGAEEGD